MPDALFRARQAVLQAVSCYLQCLLPIVCCTASETRSCQTYKLCVTGSDILSKQQLLLLLLLLPLPV